MKLLFGYPTVNLGPMSRGKLHAILITVALFVPKVIRSFLKRLGP